MMKSSRQIEGELIVYCARVACGEKVAVSTQREANVLAVAAKALGGQFHAERERMREAAESYLCAHENERLGTSEVIRAGWVVSLPRMNDFLTRQICDVRRQHVRTP